MTDEKNILLPSPIIDAKEDDVDGDGVEVECRKEHDRIKRDSNENHSLKEPLLLVHFKSFRYSDGEQPFCL